MSASRKSKPWTLRFPSHCSTHHANADAGASKSRCSARSNRPPAPAYCTVLDLPQPFIINHEFRFSSWLPALLPSSHLSSRCVCSSEAPGRPHSASACASASASPSAPTSILPVRVDRIAYTISKAYYLLSKQLHCLSPSDSLTMTRLLLSTS